jgi:penicillin-binding protein 1A
MAWGRKKSGGRKEPLFGLPAALADLRLSPEDRIPAAGDKPKKSSAKRKAEDSDDEPARERKPRAARSGSRRRAKSRGGFSIGRLFYWGAVLGLWAAIAVVGVIVWVGAHLPAIQSLEIPKRPPTIQIVGLDGSVLAQRGEMAGANVSLKDLPPYLPKAFIAIEDRRFYSHYGVDPIGIARAAVANVLHRGVSQGGSTLTQQLAKNLFLTQERTMQRKLQEVELALWLERKHSKSEILELYLNRVYFGSGAYGVEAAAQRYFGKSARQVKVGEAAMLAGVVKSPSRLAPNRNPAGAERRAQTVLAAMGELGFITETMMKTAQAQPARAVKPAGAGSVNYVADWIMDVLDDLVGRVEADLVVETSIDPVLQAAAEKALIEELAQKGPKLDVAQGAIVAMTPDGAVRALVGGRNYAESQFNRAVAAKRQPGSAFKPFVYLTALERGLTPESVREDKPIALKGWKPENYSREYFGTVTLTQALAMSLNTVAVRLTLESGAPNVAKTAYRLGIASKLDPNPSLALGTSEVSVIELVAAYAPFANGGFAAAPHVVERVRTTAGKTLYLRSNDQLGRIIEARHVAQMNAMMRETLRIGTAKSAQIGAWPAAGKTGTSQDFRDAWFVGYTGQFVAGVWVGNDDGRAMNKVMGGSLPARLWHDVMLVAHDGRAPSAAVLAARNGQPADQRPQPLMPRERIGSEFVDRVAGEDGNAASPPSAPRGWIGTAKDLLRRGLDFVM